MINLELIISIITVTLTTYLLIVLTKFEEQDDDGEHNFCKNYNKIQYSGYRALVLDPTHKRVSHTPDNKFTKKLDVFKFWKKFQVNVNSTGVEKESSQCPSSPSSSTAAARTRLNSQSQFYFDTFVDIPDEWGYVLPSADRKQQQQHSTNTNITRTHTHTPLQLSEDPPSPRKLLSPLNDDSCRIDEQQQHNPEDGTTIISSKKTKNAKTTPLIVFVNTKSGSQQGRILANSLRSLVNPIQICDLSKGGEEEARALILSFTRAFASPKILVCGGDGTVHWILQILDRLEDSIDNRPPVAILPLGTGNDLARILNWGGGYNGGCLVEILCALANNSRSMKLDRWSLKISPNSHDGVNVNSNKATISKKKKRSHTDSELLFTNYIGIGVDADAALQVHTLRNNMPALFRLSRIMNKLFYGILGAPQAIKFSYPLHKLIVLECDGKEVPLPKDCQGLIALNIDSYAGGVPLWSRALNASRISSADDIHDLGFVSSGSASEDEDLSMWRGSSTDTWPRKRSFIRQFNNSSYSPSRHFNSLEFGMSRCDDGKLDIVSIRGAFHLGQLQVGLSNARLLSQCKSFRVKMLDPKKKIPIQMDGEPWTLPQDCTLDVKQKLPCCIMLERGEESGSSKSTIPLTRVISEKWANGGVPSFTNSTKLGASGSGGRSASDLVVILKKFKDEGRIDDALCRDIMHEFRTRRREERTLQDMFEF